MKDLKARFDRVDALRGVAVVWMTAFHFSFDLAHSGLWAQNFYADPFWTWQRVAIVSLFLFCAGLGQAVAAQHAVGWPHFWRRWAQVAGCALLVSAGSAFMFPNSWIYFGVLHGIAVMLVIARLTARCRLWLWPMGALAIASKFIAAYALSMGGSSDFFNQKAVNWLGWITQKPVTEDYVPLFPWLGVLWWGMAAGFWLLQRHPQWLQGSAPRALAWLGRWSLPYYMLHQPVLIGLVTAFAWAKG
nr:heparan-alpha-glucosaminide N-acetyltransferase [uncultured Albidiferax sp.]